MKKRLQGIEGTDSSIQSQKREESQGVVPETPQYPHFIPHYLIKSVLCTFSTMLTQSYSELVSSIFSESFLP